MPVGIPQITATRVANAKLVGSAVVHKNLADGFASASGGYSRRVGDTVGKLDCRRGKNAVSSRASGKSVLNGLDVYRVVRARKQWREIEELVGWLVVGMENLQ